VSKRLVTIATFDQPAQARLAQNALTEAGVAATVTDESLVAMDWLLSNAVGGVKVQVWDDDAEKAVRLLESRFGEHGEGFGSKVSEEELAAAAEVATPEEGDEPSLPISEDDDKETPTPAPESRENYARRLVFTAMLGLIFPPIAVYATYLFLNAAFGEGYLSSRGKYNLYLGLAMTLAGLMWLPFFLRYPWAP
jgi:hypothetical protein